MLAELQIAVWFIIVQDTCKYHTIAKITKTRSLRLLRQDH